MIRADALRLIGRPVKAITAVNGAYVGTLVEVTDDRPWRGVVAISGVLEPALAYEIGRYQQRRGFRPGERIEVVHSSIEATDQASGDYPERA